MDDEDVTKRELRMEDAMLKAKIASLEAELAKEKLARAKRL